MKRIDWGQAFAEVILLLVGIGLALVVDWWADRARDRAAEQEHLAALRADFEVADSTL